MPEAGIQTAPGVQVDTVGESPQGPPLMRIDGGAHGAGNAPGWSRLPRALDWAGWSKSRRKAPCMVWLRSSCRSLSGSPPPLVSRPDWAFEVRRLPKAPVGPGARALASWRIPKMATRVPPWRTSNSPVRMGLVVHNAHGRRGIAAGEGKVWVRDASRALAEAHPVARS